MSAAASAGPRLLVAIPCFNEARFIANIVAQARKFVPDVLVVDDGSTDATAQLAADAGATVIRHGCQGGPGAAIRTGFLAAIERGADILVTLDGDGQHNPDDLPALIEAALGGADIVIGSRFLRQGYAAPRYRKFGIDVITWMFNFASKVKVTDSQSGYRAYSRKALSSLVPTERGFSFSIQTLVEARRLKLRIVEVPVSCIYHEFGSTRNPIIHGLGVALSVARLRLARSMRRGPAREADTALKKSPI